MKIAIFQAHMPQLVQNCAQLWAEGKRFVLVSSGAVALGIKELDQKIDRTKMSVEEKQACAAIGQNLLMTYYKNEFAKYHIKVAQVLVTSNDFRKRQSYLNLRNVMEKLLELGVLPIVNENDCVSTFELGELNYAKKSFGDNDLLSSLLASKLNAELLFILSNVDGIYEDSSAQKIVEEIYDITQFKVKDSSGSQMGRGGIQTKIEAARIASISNIPTLICSGHKPENLMNVFHEKSFKGTFVHPLKKTNSRKKWIGVSSGYEGVVVVNEGAKVALMENKASLLAVGVIGVQGYFSVGDVVSIQDGASNEIGRGQVLINSTDLEEIMGMKSSEIKENTTLKIEEIINRDHLLLYR